LASSNVGAPRWHHGANRVHRQDGKKLLTDEDFVTELLEARASPVVQGTPFGFGPAP
jgi:hypothetical protein